MKEVALITGGAKSIGKAICEKFAKEGFDIVLVDFDEETALETKKELEQAFKVEVTVVKCDISDLEQVKNVRKTVEEKYGHLTHLVNNAAVCVGMDGPDLSIDKFVKTININLNGTFYMVSEFTPLLLNAKDDNPSIVNIASTAAFTGGGGNVPYAASKGGVVSMTRAMARWYGPMGLRVNGLAPTLIITELMKKRFEDNPEDLEKRLNSVPLRRFMSEAEVAEIAYFLTKPTYIHGEVIVADGGRSVGN